MSVSQAQRFEMQVGLRAVLGDDVGNTLMEHLPPSGWSDVARAHDIVFLDGRIDEVHRRIDEVHRRIDSVEKRIDGVEHELHGIRNSLRALAASMVAVSAAIIVLLIQLNQNISRL